MPEPFTGAFLAALFLTTLLRLWLARRQMAHVIAHRDRVPRQFADRVDFATHSKAADYTIAKTRLGIVAIGIDVVATLALTVGGGLQWLDATLAAWSSGLTQGVLLLASMFLILAVIDLPVAVYRQFVVEDRFGFNRMTPSLFVSDLVKQAALAAAIGLPALYVALWLMAGMGEAWWLWVWAFWAAFNVLMIWIYPTWIAPLFNKFSPLADSDLKARIEALLERCGFRSNGLFVMDGSRRSAHGNAYFTGFGRNKRIVFFDTLIERLGPAEVEAVLAHELGHFKRRHVIKRIGFSFLVALLFLWLLAQAMQAPWFFSGLGVTTGGTAVALALFFLVVPAFAFPLTPIGSALSRRHEFEADQYACENTSAGDLARALVKLYADNAATLTPDPWHSRFYDSHPPAAERVARLDAWPSSRPQAQGDAA